MATTSDNRLSSSLEDLPEELSLAIIEELDMASIFALFQSCRKSHRLANPRDEARRGKLEKFLLNAQSFPRWKDGFACFSCAKVLPRDSFASSQTKDKRGRNATFENQVRRFCISCGVSKNRYAPGNQIRQGDEVEFICRMCKEVRGGEFCERCAICSSCDHTYCMGLSLKRCEEAGKRLGHSHEIVGSGALPYVAPTLATRRFDDNYRGSVDSDRYNGYDDYHEGYYDSNGRRVSQEFSPEWYDGSDDI